MSQAATPIGAPPKINMPLFDGGDNNSGCLIIFIIIVVSGILIGGIVLLHNYLGSQLFWLNTKLFLLAICISFIPSILAGIKNSFLRVILEILCFSACITFVFWTFNINLSFTWIMYGSIIIIILVLGGFLNEINTDKTIERIKYKSDTNFYEQSLKKIEKLKKFGKIIYTSIPLSIFIGIIISIIRRSDVSSTLTFIMLITSSVLVIELFIITIVNFFNMSNPLLYMEYQEALDLNSNLEKAYTINEVRILYLWDSIHSIVLIVIISIVLFELLNVRFADQLIVLISLFIALSFTLSQLPYMIGQSIMRGKLLKNIHGLKREEAIEKLDKYMPLFPMGKYISRLSMSGTAGYIVFRLLDKVFMDGISKTLGINP